MALITATQLKTLDHVSYGQPFVDIAVDTRYDLQKLDNVSYGQPFVGAEDELAEYPLIPVMRSLRNNKRRMQYAGR
jgi:hypothetical protein